MLVHRNFLALDAFYYDPDYQIPPEKIYQMALEDTMRDEEVDLAIPSGTVKKAERSLRLAQREASYAISQYRACYGPCGTVRDAKHANRRAERRLGRAVSKAALEEVS